MGKNSQPKYRNISAERGPKTQKTTQIENKNIENTYTLKIWKFEVRNKAKSLDLPGAEKSTSSCSQSLQILNGRDLLLPCIRVAISSWDLVGTL